MDDARKTPERFDVALESERAISDIGPSAFLDHGPAEDEELMLEDGTRAIVKYLATGKEGQTVIWARRLPRE
jgi:hypothetical protein